eukprot:COSAG02_NODE_7074_length_3196_cov_3.087405_6_plen_131_part_00
MKVAPLTPAFGAVCSEVDIDALTHDEWTELESAFHAGGGLLLVRGQDALSSNPLAVARFAERFGALEDNAKYFQMGLGHQLHPEIPEILFVGNALGDSSMMINVDPKVRTQRTIGLQNTLVIGDLLRACK